MDIQRGDQVYYRGEVWEIGSTSKNPTGPDSLYLIKDWGTLSSKAVWAPANQVQRVEQVR